MVHGQMSAMLKDQEPITPRVMGSWKD